MNYFVRKLNYGLLVLITVFSTVSAQTENLVGLWEFDNPANLTQATLGNDLQLVGTQFSVSGVDLEDGAISIGDGSYYICQHDISPNGDGGSSPSRVNQYTLVFDFKISTAGQWHSFFQTSTSNSDDADAFIGSSGKLGVGATGYAPDNTVGPGVWYRLVISVNLGVHYDYYLNGVLVHSGGVQDFNGRFSLSPANSLNKVLFFADNDDDDKSINISSISIYDRDLTAVEIAELGSCSGGATEPDLTTEAMKPYLQSPTSSSIYISWHSIVDVESTVEYGTTDALGQSESGDYYDFDLSKTRWHTVKLTNLTPDTEYFYRCKTDTSITEIYRFRTNPADMDSTGHVRFVVYGDTRTNYHMHADVVKAMRLKLTELYGEDFHNDVNLVFNVGDIVTSGTVLSQYVVEHFYPSSFLSANLPFMVSIGNHEVEASYYYKYMKYEDLPSAQPEKYYSFRIGKILFISLNSNISDTFQSNWLINQLEAAETNDDVEMVFAFLHHPGRSEMWPDGNNSWVQNTVIPILNLYDKVEMLTYGHSHNYERGATAEGNLRLMLNGGGGSSLDYWGAYNNQSDYPEIHRTMGHYCYSIIDIDIANNSYTAETYSLGNNNITLYNTLIDSFSRNNNLNIPLTPAANSPAGDTYGTVVLKASAFSGDVSIMSSQFQVSNSGSDWETLIVDSHRDWENIYGVGGGPNYEPINLNAGIDLSELTINDNVFQAGQSYQWRVRYRDQNLSWSDWSDVQTFNYTSTSGINDGGQLPHEFTLHQNYPNPFNSTTTISYDTQKASRVKLEIFTLTGQSVKVLVNTDMAPGHYEIKWDGGNDAMNAVATGQYFYTLTIDGDVETKKMIELK